MSARTRTDYDVEIAMRDGTVLRATVVRPAHERPVPVVLMRTPYPQPGAFADIDLTEVARRDLALVVQSARGTDASDGTFAPWVDEPSDGADTIAWCAAQPWCDGRVVTLGRSYLAHTQIYAAPHANPAPTAMSLGVVCSAPYDLNYTGGVFNLGSALNWALGMTGMQLERRAAHGEDVESARQAWTAAWANLDETYRTLPLRDLPAVQSFPYWAEWVDHAVNDDFWRERDVPPAAPIPTLIVAGWHDVFLESSLTEYAKRADHPGTRLVVGPWSHGTSGRALGAVDYGAAAAPRTAGLMLDFVAGHLAGDAPTTAQPVRVFVMGDNTWRDLPAWPPPTTELALHLHADGRLDLSPEQAAASPSTFTFDPADPVPTRGGPTLLATGEAAGACGQVDQRALDARTDIVRFATAPLEEPVTVMGLVSVVLHVATSAADTDWTVKLVDVAPDGTALNVVDGIVRARHANPSSDGALLAPHEPHELTVAAGSTAYTFAAGHQIRLDVSSSNFPRFDRNPGTGATSATASAADLVVARQSVFHDAAHPSRLLLPVSQT